MNNDWQFVPLNQVLTPISRPETVDPQKTYNILGAHWYATGLYTKDIKTGAQIQATTVYRVEEGDFVYNRLFAWKGSFALATAENHGCYVSNEFPCFRINQSQLDPLYLWYYFRRETVWEEALGLSSGSTPTSRNRLKENKLLAIKIPLASLDEQRRIVAHIETLAAYIAEARGLRQGAVGEAEKILGSASNDLFESYQTRPLKELISPLSRISYGVLVPGSDVDDGIPFVRVQDLTTRGHSEVPNKRIDPEVEAKYVRTRLRGGEVLLGVVGSIGKVGTVPDSWIGANIARAVCRIEPAEGISQDYLAWVLQSQKIKNFFADATRTLAQPTLNVGFIEKTPIPLPLPNEQQHIVTYLNNMQSHVDTLKRLQVETTAELNALLPSLLDQAFKGNLSL